MQKKLSLVLIFLMLFNSNLMAETIRLVAGDAFPPLMWNDQGTPRGVAVELAKAIIKKAGYNIKIETCPWKRCQQFAEEEGAFITGFSKNDERLKKFIYSDVIMYDDVVIVTKKGKEFDFKNAKNLNGKVIGAQPGVGFGEHNQGLKPGMVVETDTSDVNRVKRIFTSRIDGGYFSLGKIGIAYSAKLAGIPMSELSILSDVISHDPNFLATGINTPHAQEKIKLINIAINKLFDDGTIAKIIAKKY